MALSAEDRARVKMHLGYPLVNPVISIGLGMPAALSTAWLLDGAMDALSETDGGCDRVRRVLKIMDGVEDLLVASQERRAVTRADELSLNENEANQLEGEYQRWGHRLAETLGSKPYHLSERYKRGWGLSGRIRSVPVMAG